MRYQLMEDIGGKSPLRPGKAGMEILGSVRRQQLMEDIYLSIIGRDSIPSPRRYQKGFD